MVNRLKLMKLQLIRINIEVVTKKNKYDGAVKMTAPSF